MYQADSTFAEETAPSPFDKPPSLVSPSPTIGVYVVSGGGGGGGGGGDDVQQCSNIQLDLKRWSASIRTRSVAPSLSPASCNYFDEHHDVSARYNERWLLIS